MNVKAIGEPHSSNMAALTTSLCNGWSPVVSSAIS